MSEDRFSFEKFYRDEYGVFEEGIYDSENFTEYGFDDEMFANRIVKLLNEMDKEICELKMENMIKKNTPPLSSLNEKQLSNIMSSERFRFISSKEHGRRCPSFIIDYLTTKKYYELHDLERLMNRLYNQCRLNDYLMNEIVLLRKENHELLKRRINEFKED